MRQGKVAKPLKICSKWLISFFKSTEWSINWARHSFKNVHDKLWLQYNLITTRCSHFPHTSCFEFLWGQNGKRDIFICPSLHNMLIIHRLRVNSPKKAAVTLLICVLMGGCVMCVSSEGQGSSLSHCCSCSAAPVGASKTQRWVRRQQERRWHASLTHHRCWK